MVKSFELQRLDRLTIGLGALALGLVALLYGVRQCGAGPAPPRVAGSSAVEKPAKKSRGKAAATPPADALQSAPAAPDAAPAVANWQPGPGWVRRPEPQVGPSGPLTLPLYPPWTEKQAKSLFIIGPKEIYDPLCGKIWQPSVRFFQPFAEYPGGKIEFVINSRAVREDDELRAEKPLLRVLVAGDSHTDGVCENPLSFANQCEAALIRRARDEAKTRGEHFDPKWIDVINGGKGTHTFFSYLGTLERLLDVDPDVFVVTVYGGNDFEEISWQWHARGNDGPSPGGVSKFQRQLKAAEKIQPLAMSQSLVSIKFFEAYPNERAIVLRAASEVMEKIQALCRERGIKLIVLYLPSRPEVEPHHPDARVPELLAAFQLDETALETTRKLANRFLGRMAELGIEAIDLRPVFQASEQSAYWNQDWHISLVGQRLVASVLARALCMRPE